MRPGVAIPTVGGPACEIVDDRPVSLTAHLECRDSPVRHWFEERFPETRSVTREANRKLRKGAATCSVPRLGEEGQDDDNGSLVGTALDYLLRACLRPGSVEQSKAAEAAKMLSRQRPIGARAIEVERAAVETIKRLEPGHRDLTRQGWRDLCVCCLVLARFEQFSRHERPSPTIDKRLVEPLRRVSGLDEFVSLALPPDAIADLGHLGPSAWEEHRGWGDVHPLVLNPDFEQSRALGGADADLVVAHRLIELKTTAKTRIVRREILWQLLGYVLADTSDEHAIREVGIVAPRWRSSISWPVGDLINHLTLGAPGKPLAREIFSSALGPPDLAGLRAEFADVVERIRPRRYRSLEARSSACGALGSRHDEAAHTIPGRLRSAAEAPDPPRDG